MNHRLRHWLARLSAPYRVFAGTYRERRDRNRARCSWCREELGWSLDAPRRTARVGRQVHAECLELADQDEKARQSWP